MRYLTLSEVLELARRIENQSRSACGVRDLTALEAALAQPRQTFSGKDLYPTVEEKAAILAVSLVQNHPFVDGNKRVGHAAMESFLILNGWEIEAGVDEQERLILALAQGQVGRSELAEWLRIKLIPSKRS